MSLQIKKVKDNSITHTRNPGDYKTYFHKDDSKSCSKTNTHFREEVDLNNIVQRVARGAQLGSDQATRKLEFRDISNVPEYQDMLNTVANVQNTFMSLPAEIRARFGNDPIQLLEFVGQDKNIDQCIELGLFEKPKDYDKKQDREFVKDKKDKIVDIKQVDKKDENGDIGKTQ